MSRNSNKGTEHLVIGGPARANLLPPEVGAAAKARVVRRRAIALIVVAVLVAVAAYAGASILTIDAEAKLAASNERTQTLLAEQAKYAEVRRVTSMLDTAAAAQRVGTSTEIDWKAYLDDVQASLPAGTLVTNFQAETATPLVDFGQPSVPLQGSRIGELTFTATSPALPDIEAWLVALSELPGYVDAAPGTITLQEDKNIYLVAITMHIDKDALLLRYDEEAKEARDQARQERAEAKEAEEKAKSEQAAEKKTGDSPTKEPESDTGTDADGGE